VSLTKPAFRLLDRCTFERDQNDGTLDDGAVKAADWQTHLEDVPCRAWVTQGDEQVADGVSVVPAATFHIAVSADTDVTEGDRVASVTYYGETSQDGPLGVRALLRRRNHIELVCTKVG
jgi:hypothetical protein